MKKSSVQILLGIATCLCSGVGLCSAIVDFHTKVEATPKFITFNSLGLLFGALLIAKALKEREEKIENK